MCALGLGVSLNLRRGSVGDVIFDFSGGSVTGLISLTRASTGSCFNSGGVLSSAAINTARMDYDPKTLAVRGFLVEPAATNVFQQSEDMSAAYWSTKSNVTITTDAIAAPDGLSTADKIVETTTATVSHLFSKASGIAFTGDGASTYSFFIKAAGRTRVSIDLFGNASGSSGGRIVFDFTGSGSIVSSGGIGAPSGTATGTITDVGNGWYYATGTITPATTGNTTRGMTIALVNTGTNITYTGDGSSGVYIWGMQLESGSTATSYIKTTTATVTRSADVATLSLPFPNNSILYTFDNATTQTVSGVSGSYTIPTNLNRVRINKMTISSI